RNPVPGPATPPCRTLGICRGLRGGRSRNRRIGRPPHLDPPGGPAPRPPGRPVRTAPRRPTRGRGGGGGGPRGEAPRGDVGPAGAVDPPRVAKAEPLDLPRPRGPVSRG